MPNQRKELLNPREEQILEEGLKSIVQKMFKDFNNNFPDAIILPDTAARPLFYALQPVIEKVHAATNSKKPRFYFFNSSKRDFVVAGFEDRQEARTGSSEGIGPDEIHGFYEEAVKKQPYLAEYKEGMMEDAKKKFDDIVPIRNAMRTRAKEIEAFELKARSEGSIAIVDEFVTEKGETAKAIRRAFDNPDIPAYAIFSSIPEEGTEDVSRVFSGMQVDPYDRSKFRYKFTKAAGVEKKTNDKHGPHATAIHNDPNQDEIDEQKTRLRAMMRAIGERVAETIVKSI